MIPKWSQNHSKMMPKSCPEELGVDPPTARFRAGCPTTRLPALPPPPSVFCTESATPTLFQEPNKPPKHVFLEANKPLQHVFLEANKPPQHVFQETNKPSQDAGASLPPGWGQAGAGLGPGWGRAGAGPGPVGAARWPRS